MKDATILVSVLLALVLHLFVGVMVSTRRTDLPLLPLINLAVALCVLGYWIPRWYAYATRGIIWYATDQLFPASAIVVCLLSAFSLAGRYRGSVPHWIVFVLDVAVLLMAAVYFMFGSIKRLI